MLRDDLLVASGIAVTDALLLKVIDAEDISKVTTVLNNMIDIVINKPDVIKRFKEENDEAKD